jgi:hypothetical protein
MTTNNVRHGGDYYKPDDFLGGGGPSEVKRPSVAKKATNLGTNKSGLDKPDFFLGGCSDQTSPRHKVKLRDSWLQPKDDSGKAPAPLLSAVEKPEDYLGGSVPDMDHHHHNDSDDETKNTKTTASSSASYQKPEEFGAGSDHDNKPPESPKKPVSPKKQQQTVATMNAPHTQSLDYHPSDFLGGSEPKPIKKWTPPPKKEEEPAHTSTQSHFQDARTQSIDYHPSGTYLL